MSEHFINLNCANCGAKLDVYDDAERFSCGYCGTEMIVQRRGGTVALKAVTEAIKKVQIGTDKTAAELALVRLEKESSELKTKYAAIEQRLSGRRFGIGCAVLLVVACPFVIAGGSGAVAAGSLLILAVVVSIALHYDSKNKARWQQELADVKSELEKLNQEADEHRRFLEGR